MFEHMDISKKVYEGGTPSKTTTRSDSDRSIHGKKQKGGESDFATNNEKGLAGKLRKNMQAI